MALFKPGTLLSYCLSQLCTGCSLKAAYSQRKKERNHNNEISKIPQILLPEGFVLRISLTTKLTDHVSTNNISLSKRVKESEMVAQF